MRSGLIGRQGTTFSTAQPPSLALDVNPLGLNDQRHPRAHGRSKIRDDGSCARIFRSV